MDLLTLLLISIPSGFIGALAGLGGGILLIPLLTLLGVPIKYAIASGMVAVIATSSGSAVTYLIDKLTNIRISMFLEIFTVTGAVLGALLTVYIPSKPLYFIFGSFLIASMLLSVKRGFSEEMPRVSKQDKLSKWLRLEGSYYDEKLGRLINYRATNSILGILGMFFAGLSGGMLGIGAGVFKTSIFELILKIPPKPATATSTFIVGMTALAGASVYLFSGLLSVYLVAPVTVGAVLGSIIGSRILNKLSNKTVRVIFTAVILYALTQILYKGVTVS